MRALSQWIKPFLIIITVLYTILLGYTLSSDLLSTFYILIAIPFILIAIYVYLYHTDHLFHLLAISLPFSLNLRDVGLGVGLSIPAELITVILAIAVVTKILTKYDDLREIFFHPIAILIYVHLGWLLITTITSSLFVVSLKFVVIRTIYIMVYYLYTAFLFKKEFFIKSFIWLYTLGLSIVIAIVFKKHWALGLGQETSNKISYPFYDDHTIYAACIVMMIPLVIALFYMYHRKSILRWGIWLLFFMLIVGLVHSYSRAGWISLTGIGVGWIVFKFKISFQQVILTLVLLVGLGIYNGSSLLDNLQSNNKDSGGSVLEHAQSASNISTDASNTERINRWMCALRMVNDKPFVGFGPGTYMFQYGKFQKRAEMTIISVRDGSWGGVHSEYLKPLSESGYLGLLTFLTFIFYPIKIGMDTLYELEDKKTKTLLVATILSFVSYLIHGFVNFFLDTDKSSILFWAMLAIITVIHIEHKKKKQLKQDLTD